MILKVEFNNWGKYQRKDIKRPSWFAMDNRVIEDAKLYHLDDAEWKGFVYLLCQSSQQQSATVILNLHHAERVCGLKKKTMESLVCKLIEVSVLRARDVDVTCTLRERDVDDTHTVQHSNKTETIQDTTRQHVTATALPRVAILWNEIVLSLPKVSIWSSLRKKAVKSRGLTDEQWQELFSKVEASDFLSGRSGKWGSCSFDWVLKPANLTKISEGNYDNRETSSSTTAPNPNQWQAQAEKVRRALAMSGNWAGRDQAEIESFLGVELMQLAIKAGTAKLRALRDGPFLMKETISLLKAAEDSTGGVHE